MTTKTPATEGQAKIREALDDLENVALLNGWPMMAEKIRAVALSLLSSPPIVGGPVAWCVAYDGPGPNEGRRVHSDPTMHKPEAEALALRTGLTLVPLYAAQAPQSSPAAQGVMPSVADFMHGVFAPWYRDSMIPWLKSGDFSDTRGISKDLEDFLSALLTK